MAVGASASNECRLFEVGAANRMSQGDASVRSAVRRARWRRGTSAAASLLPTGGNVGVRPRHSHGRQAKSAACPTGLARTLRARTQRAYGASQS